MKKITNLIVLSLLSLSIVACSQSAESENTGNDVSISETNEGDKTVVTIGYLPITHALAVIEEKTILDREDSDITIELTRFSSWTDLMDALNSGNIDGASVLIELAMSAKSQGIDLKAIALGHRDGNVIVASDDIESVSDLSGKTIAIPSTHSSHNILIREALSDAGLNIDDISIVQLAPTEMPSSLASGSISAYCVAEPFGAQAVSLGFGHVLYNSEELWENSLCCSLVLNQSSIDRLTDTELSTLIDTYHEAGGHLEGDESIEIAKEYLGQDEDVLETSLSWITYDDLEITEDDYNELSSKVIEYGINDNPPSYEDFVYRVTN